MAGRLPGSVVGDAIVRGAVSSALTQGLAVATGLQPSFSWRSVAASAAGSGVGAGLNEAMGITSNGARVEGLSFADRLARGTVSALGSGLTTAALRGGRVSVTKVATDAFGNALGDSLAGANGHKAKGQGPWSERDYRNGLDINSDNAYYDRMTQWAVAQSRDSISDSASDSDVTGLEMRQRGFGPDWSMNPVADRSQAGVGIDDDRDPTSNNYRDEKDRASDAATKLTVIDNTKQVYTPKNLATMPRWKIQGAGDPELASAMTQLQGERDKATGEWIPYDQSKADHVLATVARVRGIDTDRVASDYQAMLDLRGKSERAASKSGQELIPFNELNKTEHRVPLLSMSAANGLPDNSAHMASIEQLRFGKMVGDALGGLDPVFGALLSPTGGIPGAGNVRVTSVAAFAAAGGIEVVTNHGIAHDAAGYLLNYQSIGPGYQYVPGNSGLFFSTKNPLGGQVSGLTLYNNVRLYGTPTAPGR